MAGRDLGAAPAAGARMNKAMIVQIAAASVLVLLLLVAAAVWLARSISTESFLKVLLAMSVMNMCLQAWSAATATTPASRRIYVRSTVMSVAQFAINLHLVLLAYREEVEDGTA